MQLVPNSAGSLVETNWCHVPAGSSNGGQFCSTDVGHSFGRIPEGSAKIPAYLKDDVRRARAAGILTYHQQQPEPVRGTNGVLYDPIAMSSARRGSQLYTDTSGHTNFAPTGRIVITTRGGVFEPERSVWDDKYGFRQRLEKKAFTPADLKTHMQATPEDVVSTFRHEMGHLIRRDFRGTKKTPDELASEISAWQYAVEIDPRHSISIPMAARGLQSHAYHVYRGETLANTIFKGSPRYRLDDLLSNALRGETERDPVAWARAKVFTKRAITSLRNYGQVLTKRGLVRMPDNSPSASYFRRNILPGPGARGL